MKVFAIDPGPIKSAYVEWDGKKISMFDIQPNEWVLKQLRDLPPLYIVIEMIAGYGMPVGKDVFETAFWVGRFYEASCGSLKRERIERRDIKLYFCGSARAKDSNIITALVDRFDPLRKFGKYGKGTKKNPGPFYGFSKDVWQAFALACYWCDKLSKG